MSEHNEPWEVKVAEEWDVPSPWCNISIIDSTGYVLLFQGVSTRLQKEMWIRIINRIVLCVNACAGMSDAQVEMFADGTMDCKACINDGISLQADLAEAESRLKTAAEMIGVLFNGGAPARKLKANSMKILEELTKHKGV